MKWTSKRNENDVLEHRLTASAPQLDAAMTDFWRRILTDAIAQVKVVPWATVAFSTIEDGEPGWLQAQLWDGDKAVISDFEYVLTAGEALTLEPDDSLDDQEAERRSLTWMLERYEQLRQSAASEPIARLYRQANAIRPLAAMAGVCDGWLDLRIGQPKAGPLPNYDAQLLAGQPATRQPTLGGLFDDAWIGLLGNLSTALVAYTPEHFKTIHCVVRSQLEGKQRRLFYEITCPDFPDEGSEDPNEDVHQATSKMIAYWTRDGAEFPGMKIVVEVQPDGTTSNHFELLED